MAGVRIPRSGDLFIAAMNSSSAAKGTPFPSEEEKANGPSAWLHPEGAACLAEALGTDHPGRAVQERCKRR